MSILSRQFQSIGDNCIIFIFAVLSLFISIDIYHHFHLDSFFYFLYHTTIEYFLTFRRRFSAVFRYKICIICRQVCWIRIIRIHTCFFHYLDDLLVYFYIDTQRCMIFSFFRNFLINFLSLAEI